MSIGDLTVEDSKSFKFLSMNTRSIALGNEISQKKKQYVEILKNKKNPRSLSNWMVVSHHFGFVCLCFGDVISFVYPSHVANLLDTNLEDNLMVENIYLKDDNESGLHNRHQPS